MRGDTPINLQSLILFPSLLKQDFERLPASLQRLHACQHDTVFAGQAVVQRGQNWLSRLCGFLARLPPAGNYSNVNVHIQPKIIGEVWRRNFGTHRMVSFLCHKNNLLCEKLGLTRLCFSLQADSTGITWYMRSVSVVGINLPLSWFNYCHIRESEENGRCIFDVSVQIRGIGLLIHYRGWLNA